MSKPTDKKEIVNTPENEFSGTIHIFRGTRDTQRQIRTKSLLFAPNEEIIVQVSVNKVTFKKPWIDYNGKTYLPKSTNAGLVSFLVAAELPCGFFDFDLEESNIDQRVVYFTKEEEETD
jgi:hypothetical protein